MQKVLILNGSPTPKGNTMALIEAFEEGARRAGNIVNRCDIRKMNIKPCVGCLGGGKDFDSPCCQKDDMDIIYRYFREADIIVFASPLYWWTFSAQLKMVIDRLFAVMEGTTEDGTPAYQVNLTPKKLMMIVPAEEDHDANFQLINQYYDGYIQRMGWEDAGRLLVGGMLGHKEHEGRPEAKEKAYMLGTCIK